MPTYDYICTDKSCEHEVKGVRQSIKDDPLIHCPSCDQDTLRRVVQPASFTIGGVGAYGKGRT